MDQAQTLSAGVYLMQRFTAHGSFVTARCTNATKDGQLHTHSLTLIDHPSGFLGISTDILHDVQHSRPAQCKDVQHNAQVIPAGASTISKDARCSTRFHELQVATGPSMPRESDSPSPVAEESFPAASEEVCADLRAAAAPPMDK